MSTMKPRGGKPTNTFRIWFGAVALAWRDLNSASERFDLSIAERKSP